MPYALEINRLLYMIVHLVRSITSFFYLFVTCQGKASGRILPQGKQEGDFPRRYRVIASKQHVIMHGCWAFLRAPYIWAYMVFVLSVQSVHLVSERRSFWFVVFLPLLPLNRHRIAIFNRSDRYLYLSSACTPVGTCVMCGTYNLSRSFALCRMADVGTSYTRWGTWSMLWLSYQSWFVGETLFGRPWSIIVVRDT